MGSSSEEEPLLVSVDEQSATIELQEIKNDLNTFLSPFPKEFKRKLISSVKKLRRDLEAQLNQSETRQLNSQTLLNISNLLNEFFMRLDEHINRTADTVTCTGAAAGEFTDETREYLLRLVEKYITTIYYGPLFQLVEIESFEGDGQQQFDEIVEKFNWISTEHLDLHLNEEDEDVRVFIYSAIRSLLLLTSVKSPHQKLTCITQFCKFVMGALNESKESDQHSHCQAISADDLMPGLIYSLLKAKVPQLLLHLSYINHFTGMKNDLEYGETAYYFTNFSAAVDFIRRLDGSNIVDSTDSLLLPKYFINSVTVIHNEVQAMNQKRQEYVLKSLKEKIKAGQKKMSSIKSDIKEKKCWNFIKWIPILNVGYGGIRSICYVCKGNTDEALNSVVGAVGGLAGLGAGVLGAAVGGPIIVPITVGMVCSGSANQVVTGGGELAIEAKDNPDLFKKLSPDGKEKKIYLKMIKDAPIVGLLYSTIRSTVYLAKGNKQEAKQTAVNAAVNAGASTVGISCGIGMAKLSTHLTNIASAIDSSDNVVKPMSTEIVEFIATQAVKVAASPSMNVAVHVGANSCSRYIIEESILNESDDCLF